MTGSIAALLKNLTSFYRENSKKVWVISIFVLLSGYAMQQWTSSPDICGNCHQIYPAYKSWRESIHAEVACDTCHMRPGIFGVAERLYLQLTKFNNPDNQPKAIAKNRKHISSACERCHSPNRPMAFGGDLIVPHKRHMKEKISCTTCHSRVVHGEGGPRTRRPKMDTCYKCHDGKRAPENCGVCHATIVDPLSEYYNPY